MLELSLMASAAFSPGIFHQDQGLCRIPKEFQALFPGHPTRQEIQRSGHLQLSTSHVGPWQSVSLFSEYNQSARTASTIKNSVLIDVQDAHPDSVRFSFGIAEQCTRHENILKFLRSGSNVAEGEGLNVSLLSDLMGLHALAIDMFPQQYGPAVDEYSLYDVGKNDSQNFIHPPKQFYVPKPLLDFFGDLSHTSMVTVHPDGQVLFTGTGAEMKNLLSIVEEFYLSKNTAKGSKQSMLVPYFRRSGRRDTHANARGTSLKLQTQTIAPLKSSEKIKLKPLPKKKRNRNAGIERDLYKRSYFHACESLLSVILYRKRGEMAILSLKKSGPELPQLLTQFSAGIAGTGLAVLFSVICKVASGRVPFCTGKLLNTGFGFGLVWLSWAMNRLRDTIVHISKNSSKMKVKEEEVMGKVESSVNEVLFRAATIMAVAMLRFA